MAQFKIKQNVSHMLSCYRTNFVALAVARSTISVEGARVQFVIFFQPSNFV